MEIAFYAHEYLLRLPSHVNPSLPYTDDRHWIEIHTGSTH